MHFRAGSSVRGYPALLQQPFILLAWAIQPWSAIFLTIPRRWARRVLVAGGFDGSAHVTTTELYDPTTGTFSPVGPNG